MTFVMKQISFFVMIGVIGVLLVCCGGKKITMPTGRAVYHNNQGVMALAGNDLDRAEFEFRTAIELSPQYVEAYNNLGIVHKRRGKLHEAEAQFERAIELDKKYAAAYSHLGAVYLAQNRIDAAIEIIQRGLKKDSTLADGHYNLGLAYLEKTKQSRDKSYIPLAEASFKKATELNANLQYVHVQLADLYQELGEYDLAIIRYRLALGDTPHSVETWLKLGNLYLHIDDPYKAQNCFQKALEINPNSEDAHMALGLFYFKQEKYREASIEFQSVTALNAFNELAWFRFGSVELALGDGAVDSGDRSGASHHYTQAARAFSKARELNPAFTDAIFNLGLVYFKQQKSDAARGAWEEALVVDSRHARTLYNLATLYQLEGFGKEATVLFCRFLSAAGNQFPTEKLAAEKIIAQGGSGCPN